VQKLLKKGFKCGINNQKTTVVSGKTTEISEVFARINNPQLHDNIITPITLRKGSGCRGSIIY